MFTGTAGLSNNNETFQDETEDVNSFEGFLGTEFKIFDLGDLDLTTQVVAYPSFSIKNRIRTLFSFDFKMDLPLNFDFVIGFTHNYDSKPPNEGSKSDYMLQTTIGWDF